MDDEALRKLRHDLRSPLFAIAGFAQLLSGDRELADAERRDYAERILRASRDLERLMDEALEP
ncbi:MAG: histidine kinase dimerization/phospho-acceptor domain-containing protein [Solirubrobacteraceae bacterium]